jgi:hypothetical protein
VGIRLELFLGPGWTHDRKIVPEGVFPNPCLKNEFLCLRCWELMDGGNGVQPYGWGTGRFDAVLKHYSEKFMSQ